MLQSAACILPIIVASLASFSWLLLWLLVLLVAVRICCHLRSFLPSNTLLHLSVCPYLVSLSPCHLPQPKLSCCDCCHCCCCQTPKFAWNFLIFSPPPRRAIRSSARCLVLGSHSVLLWLSTHDILISWILCILPKWNRKAARPVQLPQKGGRNERKESKRPRRIEVQEVEKEESCEKVRHNFGNILL